MQNALHSNCTLHDLRACILWRDSFFVANRSTTICIVLLPPGYCKHSNLIDCNSVVAFYQIDEPRLIIKAFYAFNTYAGSIAGKQAWFRHSLSKTFWNFSAQLQNKKRCFTWQVLLAFLSPYATPIIQFGICLRSAYSPYRWRMLYKNLLHKSLHTVLNVDAIHCLVFGQTITKHKRPFLFKLVT